MELTGKEKFIYNNKELDFDITDFWKYKFSEIYDLQSEIAEFIVEKALGLKEFLTNKVKKDQSKEILV